MTVHCSLYKVDCFVGFGRYFIYSLEENDGWQKHIKRGVHTSHTEETAIPDYMSLVNFGTWPYYHLMVGMVFVFISIVLYWSWTFKCWGDGATQGNR